MPLFESPHIIPTSTKINFHFQTQRYNQYVQTHMTWNEDRYLTKREKEEIGVRSGFLVGENSPQKHVRTQPKRQDNLVKMPISKFEMDRMNQNISQGQPNSKTSLQAFQQPSFLMNSNIASHLSLKSDQFLHSIQTQTQDFTFISQLYSQPKIYQIPVQLQVQETDYQQQEQRGVQTIVDQLQPVQYKLQRLGRAAVFRQQRLRMNLGVMNVNATGCRKEGSRTERIGEGLDRLGDDGNDRGDEEGNEGDFLEEEQKSQELLLQNDAGNNDNEALFRTASFQQVDFRREFYTISTPQKSHISGGQSSPDTTGPMRISETEINMMHTRQCPSTRIDEEEFEDLQGRVCLLEQENSQKNAEIEILSKKIEELERQLSESRNVCNEKNILQQKYLQLQTQLNLKSEQCSSLQQTLYQVQTQLTKLQQSSKHNQEHFYQTLNTKQKHLSQLEQQLKSYRQELVFGEEKYTKENQALQKFISQKDQEISEMKAQYDRKYELYVVSIRQMKGKIHEYQLKLEELENAILDKDAKISHYQEENVRLREQNSILYKRIDNLKEQFSRCESGIDNEERNSQNNPANNIKIRENIGKTNQKQNHHIEYIQQQTTGKQKHWQVDSNSKDFKKKQNFENHHQNEIQANTQLQHQQQKAKLPLSKTKQRPYQNKAKFKISGVPSVIQNSIQFSSLNPSQIQISESSLQQSHQSESSNESNMCQQQGTISITESNQFSKFASYSFQKPSQLANQNSSNFWHQEQYIRELQKIVLNYEGIIEKQVETIEELQQKVLEFLKDALTKESEAEFLYSQLCQYENSLNGLLVEKLNTELQNQRLNKIITESQSKLSFLGSRLIKLAQYNSSLNST